MNQHLRSTLSQAIYVKQTNLHQISHLLPKMGYEPRLVVTFRSFGDYARSRYLRFGWDMPRLIDAYLNT